MNLSITITYLLGGLGLFIYGITLTSSGLELIAARRMRAFLQIITNNPFLGVIVGIILTVFMQSSTALTVLVVSLVSAKLLNLRQALGMILGSAIGTTFTVQLIAFKITDYALVAVAIGVLLLFIKKYQLHHIGQAILGFGLMFYGMALMTDSMEPLKEMPGFVEFVVQYSNSTYLLIVVGILITLVIQSSAATIAIAMSLAEQGILPLLAVIGIVLGANIGTTGTALISSLASSREAKRVAVAHVIFKVAGVLVLLPFLDHFTRFIQWMSPDLSRQIANSNTLYNVINLIMFFPFVPAFAKFMTIIIPDKKEVQYDAKFVDDSMIALPDLALRQTKKEIVYIGEKIDQELFKNMPHMLSSGDYKMLGVYKEVEHGIDDWYRMITKFMAEVAQENLTVEQTEEEIKLLYAANYMEKISDLQLSLAHYGEKIKYEDIQLSEKDWDNLNQLQSRVAESFRHVITALETDNFEIARKVIYTHPEIVRIEKDLRFEHYHRVNSKTEFLRATSIYLDVVSDLVRTHHYIVSIAQTMLGVV